MKTYYTYVHRRLDTGDVFYVGKGGGNPNRAWDRWNRSDHWKRVVAKHGYSVEVVADGLTEENATRQEKRLIKLYSRELLINKTDGGEGCSGRSCSDETRAKIGSSNAKVPRTQEWKDKIAATLRGRKASAETRAKLSAVRMGRVVSEETRAKIRASNLGKKRSAEARARSSEAHKGPLTGSRLEHMRALAASRVGVPRSAEVRAKISAGHKRRKEKQA